MSGSGPIPTSAGSSGALASDLRTIWYMGAKTRLCAEFIEGAVADLLPPGGTLVDLCAGTSAVARTFAPRHRVIANDVQRFSSTIARAHLEGSPAWVEELERLDPDADLGAAVESNRAALERLAPLALEAERTLLPGVIEELSAHPEHTPRAEEYRSFVAATPPPLTDPEAIAESVRRPEDGRADLRFAPLAEAMPGLLRQRRLDPTIAPYALITAYSANVYFGLEQAIAIDSFRAAIDAIPERAPHREAKRALYLAALVQAASVSTSGTSHFAQPRGIGRDAELLAVARRRSIEIDVEFYLALDAIRREWSTFPRLGGNRVHSMPAEALLAPDGPLAGEEVGLVYFDPPYTADNYSRFYHLLETLVSYDYPELAMRGGALTRGRYPVGEKRFQSPFCSAESVEDAFRGVISRTRELGANLLISYAGDQGLLMQRFARQGHENPVARFRELCREYYPSVEIRERELMHSGQGDSNRAARELLVLCERTS